ncbi:hypothetical protein B0H14DRAFT_3664007 [Mycena olivaceomarginata]|nr:hypothetical protein B0H14DRAFT_3664007 [Mycena olivaceomarginata]
METDEAFGTYNDIAVVLLSQLRHRFPVTDLPHTSPRAVPASPAPCAPARVRAATPVPAWRCLDSACGSRPVATLAAPSARVPAGFDVPTSQRPRPVSAHAARRHARRTPAPISPLPPCSACPSHSALSAHPFRPTSTPLPSPPPMRCHPHSVRLHPCSPPRTRLRAGTTLVLSTDGVGMNHTAVREHYIDLKALNKIIAPGDASRINAAALEAQRWPNPALQPVHDAAPAPGNLLEHAAQPLHPHVQVDTPDLLRAALPPADPAALATVPRGGRALARSGLGSVRSSAFLSVFVVVYLDTDFVPYAALLSCFYLPKTIVYVVAWAVEVLANVGRASGVRDGRQRKASRASPATLRLPPAVFFLITVRASDHTNLAPHTPLSGGRAEAMDRVLAKQPAHRSRGTVGPASPQVACASLSKAAITLLFNRRTITYFGRLELSLALEGHAEAAEWEEAKVRPCASSPVGCLFGVGVDVTLPRSSPADLPFSFTRPAPWRAELGVSDDVPTPFKLFRALICVSAGGLGRWAPIAASAPHVHPLRATPTPTLFRTRRILQHIFYLFIVCPPIPTLDEHFWIDVQAPTGVSPISPCATQGDFFKEPSPITPHSIPPSPKVPGWTFEHRLPPRQNQPCAVKPNSSFEAPSPNPHHLGQGSWMDIQALAPVPPIFTWRCHGEFRSLRTLDHPSPPCLGIPGGHSGAGRRAAHFTFMHPSQNSFFLSNLVHLTPPFPQRSWMDVSGAGRRPAKLTWTESRRFCFLSQHLHPTHP